MLRANLHEAEICRLIGVQGTGDLVVEGVAPLGAREDRCLYFIEGEITEVLRSSFARLSDCIVIAPHGFSLVDAGTCRILQVTQPRAAIAKILRFIRDERRQLPLVEARRIAESADVSPLAFVDGNVEIGEGAVVEPFCTIGPDVVIGPRSVIRSGARIYPRVSIGSESVVGANAVIGSEGFGFVRDEIGNKTRIPHLGGVIVGSDVELGVLSLIQSGTISPTIVEDHVKISECCLIGHNVRLGRGASITGGVIVGGSATIGDEAWIGINSSIRNGRQVGTRALVGMDASVQQDLDENTVVRAPRPDVRKRTKDDNIGFKNR